MSVQRYYLYRFEVALRLTEGIKVISQIETMAIKDGQPSTGKPIVLYLTNTMPQRMLKCVSLNPSTDKVLNHLAPRCIVAPLLCPYFLNEPLISSLP